MKPLSLITYKDKSDKTRTFNIPENWNELTVDNLLYIGDNFEAWRMLISINESLLKAKCLLFINFTGLVGKAKFELIKNIEFLPETDQLDLINLTDFVFEKIDLTVNKIKKIKVGDLEFYGPDDDFGNISIGEFAFADNFFMRYFLERKEEDLDLMIGCLYRPKTTEKYTGDDREKFNKNKIESFTKRLKKMSYAHKVAIFLWYSGCRESLVNRYPEPFSKTENIGESNQTWINVIIELSGDKFGDFETTNDTNIHLVMMEIQMAHNKMLEQEKNNQ